MSFTSLCFLSSLYFLPHPRLNPNSLSFPLCCSCQNPPASSISPSSLAFSREVIHGIALPQANSSTKIPWEHGGMAGVSRAGRAAARSHTQAAGKRPCGERENCWGSVSSWCGHSCQQGWCQYSHSHFCVHQSHLVPELGGGSRYVSPFENLSCCPKLSLFWFSSLSVLGQVLLVFNPLPEFCRSRDGGKETEEKKKSSSSFG